MVVAWWLSWVATDGVEMGMVMRWCGDEGGIRVVEMEFDGGGRLLGCHSEGGGFCMVRHSSSYKNEGEKFCQVNVIMMRMDFN
ncbi:hypothetical protein Tco_0178405 [Tanacetum coccineum]